MSTIKRILVPMDFGETSEGAADFAVDLAGKLGASVTLMHAFEVPIYTFPTGALVATAEDVSGLSTAMQTALNTTAARHGGSGVAIDTLIRDGVPWEEINSCAAIVHADLVVIGTHGRNGLARALLGSVAEKVVRTSTCPVLTVRKPAVAETTECAAAQ